MIAVASVRGRWRELLAAVLAVAVGVGLLGAVLLAAAASRPGVQERLAATSALVVAPPVVTSTTPRSHGRIPWSGPVVDALADRLAASPGTTAVPDRSFPAVALPGGRPVGDPDDLEGGHGVASLVLGGYRVTAGERPRGPGDVLVPRTLGVGPGDRLAVQFADTVRTMRVSGTTDGPGLWVDDAEAARLAPGVRTIGVLGAVPPAPPDTTVLTGDDRAAVEPVQEARVRWRGDQLLAALALLTAVTTVVVVGAALSTAVAGRRRELGLLRAAGALPGRVRRLVLGESALVGLLGAAAGTVLAVVSAAPLHAVLVATDAARPAPVPAAAGPLAAGPPPACCSRSPGGSPRRAGRSGRRRWTSCTAPVPDVGRREAASSAGWSRSPPGCCSRFGRRQPSATAGSGSPSRPVPRWWARPRCSLRPWSGCSRGSAPLVRAAGSPRCWCAPSSRRTRRGPARSSHRWSSRSGSRCCSAGSSRPPPTRIRPSGPHSSPGR
ncbi:FtsX-like permease family protein [Pseudonocardia sp. HH130629-09]|uniref:FtsX-like permease family protein n=1 Tax=Pseudonocardia sp. HH130629-09 TaxID=1641402 RepID=UPI0007621D0A|nr:ABC transporter permease [Pseudonocardia sp. HH130629-09]